MTDYFIVIVVIFIVVNPVLCVGKSFYPSRYLQNHLILKMFGKSFESCKRACLARLRCDSVNYCQKKTVCELNWEEDKSQNVQLTRERGWAYARKENWKKTILPQCDCPEGETCEVIVDQKWMCEVTECMSPDNPNNDYEVHGNIFTTGGKIIMMCSKYLWIVDEYRPPRTLICKSTGNWEILDSYPQCGRVVLRVFGILHQGLLRIWRQQRNNDESCIQYPRPEQCTRTYRHDDIDKWVSLNVSRVMLSIVKNDVQVHYVLFNGTGSTVENWFSKERLLKSSWSDLNASTVKVLSTEGDTGYVTPENKPRCFQRRRFMIGKTSGDCETDSGWFLAAFASSKRSMCCTYEMSETLTLRYSNGSSAGVWNKPSEVDTADYIDIIILTEN